MAPADDFVEDFVGADRALKRLALMRVRDIDLWQAPLAFVGQSTSEVRVKLNGAEVPHPLVVDSSAARSAGCRRLIWRTTPCPSGPIRVQSRSWTSTTSCATRSPICCRPRPSTRRSRCRGTDRRCPLRGDHLGVPHLAGGEGRGARRGRAPTGGMSGAGSIASYLAQVEIRDRSEERGLRRRQRRLLSTGRSTTLTATSPTLEHFVLVTVSVVAGFLLALGLALLSHRRRWLIRR